MQEVKVELKDFRKEGRNIFDILVVGNLLRNINFLNGVRLFLLFLVIYAIVYGFINPTKENLFTTGLFWGLFWPFFMVITLPTVGRFFCAICPHGFLVRFFTKIGLNKNLPVKLKNPLIGLFVLILVYWFVVYTFPSVYNNPLPTALLFLAFTIIAITVSFVFRNGVYCKYFCPIGSICTSFNRVGFTWLSTKHEDCLKCKKPDCAIACPYKFNPSKFDSKNSMEECTLCMECANACSSVRWEIRKWGHSLYEKIPKPQSFEVWTYILIIGVITITMKFHHGLSRTGLADSLPWTIIGKYLDNIFHFPKGVDIVGFVALLMGIGSALLFSTVGFYIASKILNTDYTNLFNNIGYAFAPIMIVGGLSHALSFFFFDYYPHFVNGISQAFFLNITVEPLASRSDPWLRIFTIFNYIAGFWSLYLIYRRMSLFGFNPHPRFKLAFLFASALPIFYILLSVFQQYAFMAYPPTFHHHHHH
jgi:polyferredoxin